MQVGMELTAYWPHHRQVIGNIFPELLQSVELASQIGIKSFLAGEHHFKDFNMTPAPIALLAHVGAMTKQQRLILAVAALPQHDVQRLAGEITMADQLTGGRLEIGFGRGGGSYETGRFGVPADQQVAQAIFEERMEAMLALLTQQDVTIDRPYTKVRGVTIMPPTFQKPHPPIWLAALRAESAYHIGKRGYHLQVGQLRKPMSFVRELVQAFRDGVSAASGFHQGIPRISMTQWVYVAKDHEDRREKVELVYQKQRKYMGLLQGDSAVKGGRVAPADIDGTPEAYAETLVIGTRTQVQERLQEFEELGFDDFIARFHVGADHAEVMASIQRLGEDVLPALRQEHDPSPHID